MKKSLTQMFLAAEKEEAAKLNFSRTTSALNPPCDNKGMTATVVEGTVRKPVDVNAEASTRRSNSGEKIGCNTLEVVWIVRPDQPIPEGFVDVLRTWKAVREHPAWKGHPQLK